MKIKNYLQKKEWAMGNGQCPECHGIGPSFHGQSSADQIGHKAQCDLAEGLTEVGGTPIMIGEFDPGYDFENYITEDGFYAHRLKCYPPKPKTAAELRANERCRKILADAFNEVFEKYLSNKETKNG